MKIKVNGKIFIFCGKCHEKIPCGEEIIIKDKVVVCKEYFQKTSVMCHDCCLPIFKHELIHEVSVGWSIDSENRSVNLVQCYLCHKEWLRETKDLKRLRRWQVLIFENHVFFTTSLLTLWLTFMAVILGIGGLEGIDVLMPKVWRYFILWSIAMVAFRIFFFMLFEFAITRILKKNKEEKGMKREMWELIRIKKKLKERVERLRKNSKKPTNYKQINNQAILQMERTELIDTIIASRIDKYQQKYQGLQVLKDQKYNYLIAKNANNESFFLVWNGPNQNANFTKEVYEKIVQEAKENNLKTPYHVYARLYLCQVDTVNFYQIPDSILLDFGFDLEKDRFNRTK